MSSLPAALLREARPKQWVKNVLVFAAPGAAGVLDNGTYLADSLVMFVAFCMVSSGTYYWNDILDHERDRQHPTKRFRPIASGAVPLPLARAVGTVLLVVGIGVAWLVRPDWVEADSLPIDATVVRAEGSAAPPNPHVHGWRGH